MASSFQQVKVIHLQFTQTGADLNWMKKMAKYTKEENEKDSHALFDMFHAIRSSPVPTIARVNGAALGGGAGLVATCDIAVSGTKSFDRTSLH